MSTKDKDKEEPTAEDAAVIPIRGQDANATVLSTITSRYVIRKHSWRGKYLRAFCLTPSAVLTLHPQTLEVTNLWEFKDVLSASPVVKSEDEFVICVRKLPSGKQDKTTFSSPLRSFLLSDLARAKQMGPNKTFTAKKVKRNGDKKDVVLAVKGWALCQVNQISGQEMATYYYHLTAMLTPVSDVAGGFVVTYGKQDRRTYMFVSEQMPEIVALVQQTALQTVGVRLGVGAPLVREVAAAALRNAEDESVFNTLAEFQVLKHTPSRHPDPAPRIMTLSDKWLVERNPGSYGVVTMRPLESVVYVVRPPDDPQGFSVHYRDGTESRYSSTAREPLIACLLDCVRATGCRDAVVVSEPVKRGLRMTPVGIPIDAGVESQLIKALSGFVAADHVENKDGGVGYFNLLIATFNANVPYSGPRHVDVNRQHRLAVQALGNVLWTLSAKPQVATLHAIRRLLAVRMVFEAFTDVAVIREKLVTALVAGLQSVDDVVVYATLEVLSALMVPLFDPGTGETAKTTDDTNKFNVISNDRIMPALLGIFGTHVKRGTSPLVVMGCVDILTTILCPPYGDTTDGAQFNAVLERVAGLGRDFFKLFHQNHCLSVVRGAGMIMRAIIEEGGDIADLVPKMQLSALVEGATLRHLHAALFTKSSTQRQVLFKDQSRQLVALWVSGCKDAEAMLSRVLPPALVYYLESTEEAPPEPDETPKAAATSAAGASANPIAKFWKEWRKQQFPVRAAAVTRAKKTAWPGTKKNWNMLFYQLRQDHLRADLVWNNHTREELREALETELRVFRQEQELAAEGFISWNHSEFIVPYDCLHRELNVGGYYLRLLMNPQPGQKAPVLRNPPEFFDMLFHRTLLEKEGELQALCIQSLTVVYKYYHKAIGPFRDIAHLVALLRQSTDRVTRDRLLQLFYVLLAMEDNAKLFVDNGGIALLTDLMTLVHFGVDHVVAPIASNLLTAGPNKVEGEWFYSIVTPGEKLPDGTEAPARKERFGPKNMPELRELFATGVVTPSTLCWAQGMEDWKPLGEVPQLRWNLMATGHPILQNVELASLLLDMLTKLCRLYPIRDADGGVIRPIPRPKRLLSGPALLPHAAQMLLTFDPVLVEKAAVLLDVLFEDNAAAVPKAYLTGIFYFALIYAGSNVGAMVRLLRRVHMSQHFREDDAAGDFSLRSILSPLLPPAMIHLLERKPPEEFVLIFLGNNDTPEAIWNHEMRGLLIDRISTHLGNFPQRLSVNPKAMYNYVPIAPVVYKQVQSELFCCHYYLRNFCDLTRFPMWPVDKEVEFLQALLVLWSKEAEQPAPSMSEEEACTTLKLKPGYTEDALRRAYFRLAKEFHPDKNPEGKAIFQKITEAYTLLSTHTASDAGKNRASLIIRSQSILYARFRKELGPFKYAGYPLLFAAITGALKSDDRPLLHVGTELCYRTILSSSLNAEELRRQQGIDILAEVMDRATSLIMPDTKPADIVAQMASYVLLTFATAASFDQCRARIASIGSIVRNVCFCLTLQHLPKVLEAALECVCCFSLEPKLAADMVSLNVLYLLVPLLFKYDYTLEDATGASAAAAAGAASSPTDSDQNQQQAHNVQAQLALLSLSRLGGLDPACEATPVIAACVRALLSPGIADLVCQRSVPDLLKDLNSNIETPLLLWNAACRLELMQFIEGRMKRSSSAVDYSPEDAQHFVFKTLARELQIGGVYVRLYNEQVRSHGTLPDPNTFCKALIAHVTREARPLTEASLRPEELREMRKRQDALGEAERATQEQAEEAGAETEHSRLIKAEHSLSRMRMAAEALRNLLRSTRGMDQLLTSKNDLQCVFSMLAITADPPTQRATLESIGVLTKNVDCLVAISEAQSMGFFAPVLSSPPPLLDEGVAALSNMLGNAKVVADCLAYGVLLYLLRAIATPTERGAEVTPRVVSAAAVAKMSSDPVHGSRVQIAVCRFLPQAFMGAMRQDAEAAVHMFDATHENPELIWNASTRTQLKATLDGMCRELYERQRADPTAGRWQLPSDDWRMVYDELKDEPELGGVYIRLFLKQPAWSLRNPKGFLEALLTRFVELYNQAGRPDAPPVAEQMRTVLAASGALMSGTPQLCDHAAKTGHLTKIISLMDSSALPKQPAAAALVSALATSQLCVESMSATPATIRALLATAQAAPEVALAKALEAIERAFQKGVCLAETSCLVNQLIACDGVAVLLRVLEGSFDMKLATDASESKARTVAALQKALSDTLHGIHLRSILEKSPIWANFSGQRHDLFLPAASTVSGLLTAGPAGSGGGAIGLLTNTPHAAQMRSDAPPDLL